MGRYVIRAAKGLSSSPSSAHAYDLEWSALVKRRTRRSEVAHATRGRHVYPGGLCC